MVVIICFSSNSYLWTNYKLYVLSYISPFVANTDNQVNF